MVLKMVDGIKLLDSLQILCAVLWLQSRNVRAWLAALLLLLVASQLSLDPPPNQVTTEEDSSPIVICVAVFWWNWFQFSVLISW